MTQGFRDKFKDFADFYFIDGPFELNQNLMPPEEALVQKGFQPPFKAWFKFLTTVDDIVNEKIIEEFE